jgi:SAM-dependent methyltransferase
MLKLNLGSGSNRLQDDYINVDLHTAADVQHDLRDPLPYEDGTVDRIYGSHVIEHFTRKEWEFVRRDWARVMKPGGVIELRCPDLLKLCRDFAGEPDNPIFLERIYGQQAHEGEFHKNGFTEESLAASFPEFDAKLYPYSTGYELHMELTKWQNPPSTS